MRARVRVLTQCLLVLWLLTGCGQPDDSLLLAQGPIAETGTLTDVALLGRGFLLVSGRGTSALTRRGQLRVGAGGWLAEPGGTRVQGYAFDAHGVRASERGELQLGAAAGGPGRATSVITIKGNLDPDAEVIQKYPAFDPLIPGPTTNFKTSVNAFDTAGAAHRLDVYFRKVEAGSWDFFVLMDGAEAVDGWPGVPCWVGQGRLAFHMFGELVSVAQQASWFPLGTEAPQPLRFDLGTPQGETSFGVDGMTEFPTAEKASTITFLGQDGVAPGKLDRFAVQDGGEVVGHFTDGTSRVLAQLGVAAVPHPEALRWTCGHLAVPTAGSGAPVLDLPGVGGRASLEAGALEVLPPEPDGCDAP